MDNIYDIYQTINFIVDKVRNGYITPEEFSKAIDIGQTSKYQYYINEYRNGSEFAMEALRPFFTHTSLTSGVSGAVTYPDDFGYLQNAYVSQNGVEYAIFEILHDELEYYTSSKISPLSSTNVKLIQEGLGCQLYPKRKITAEYHYVSKPTTPYLAYTTDGVTINPFTGSGGYVQVDTISTAGAITGNTFFAGSGYTDGSYTDFPLIGGSGINATADFTVTGGVITALSIVNAGTGYVVGDNLTIGSIELGFDKQFWVEIMNEALKYIGLNLSNQELLQVMAQQK